MFSIIICSISPDRLQQVTQNIQNTIGVEHEIIAIDNREKHWPIARAYNEGAAKACYPYLFFVHEDVKFHTVGWGNCIAQKLKDPDCGVIGFAGSKVKLKCYSGWGQFYDWNVIHYYQRVECETRYYVASSTLERPFEEVLTLDGFAMFVRKNLWKEYPFDENLLTGFHCYDLDFSLQIASSKRYKNYVCCLNDVLIEHSSLGHYNHSWYQDTIRMHKLKWNKMLPMKVDSLQLDKRQMRKQEERYFSFFLRDLLKNNYPEKKAVLKEFLSYSFSLKHLGHCIVYICRYLM